MNSQNGYQIRQAGVTILTGRNGSGKTQILNRLNQGAPARSVYMNAEPARMALTGHVKIWIKSVADAPLAAKAASMLVNRGWAVDDHGSPWPKIQPAACSAGQLRLLWMVLAVSTGCPENGLMLVDEAEQSLHVGWQRKLVWEMEEIAQQRGIQVVLSTHAPAVIDDAWEWVTSLDGETANA